MKVQDIMSVVQAKPLADSVESEIEGCYISDLLSDVLAHAGPGMLWVTIQIHRNVISVAATKDVSAILFTCGRQPEPEIVAEAGNEGIALLTTPLTTFEAAGKLWKAGMGR